MNEQLTLFLPCAAGVESLLAAEVNTITQAAGEDLLVGAGGVLVRGTWRDVMRLNLHSRLAQRVLMELLHTDYGSEDDVYEAAHSVVWSRWFGPQQTFKVEITARRSPLRSLNFAALRIKDAVADHFRAACGVRPSVDTHAPQVRIHAHLDERSLSLSIDTSGEALFKRGWRQDTGDAPLKETLAAAMLAASGWAGAHAGDAAGEMLPLYDPCCGSGTIAIEAAQIARRMAAGLQRRFAFEQLAGFDARAWAHERACALDAVLPRAAVPIFGSDIAHRMVDFAQRNAQRAGVGADIVWRGGDALQRQRPCDGPGVLMLNPPYGERIHTAGFAGSLRSRPRRGHSGVLGEVGRYAHDNEGVGGESGAFFPQLAAHWKRHFGGWTAWVLAPLELDVGRALRLKPSRRVPLFNGPIECRLLRFELVVGSARNMDKHAQ